MRYFIDEQLSINSLGIQAYILDIKDFTKEALINELLEIYKSRKTFPKKFYNHAWEQEIRQSYKNSDILELITRVVEEKFWIFNDTEEHPHNKEVVESIINRKTVCDRYTGEQYNFK